MGFEDTIRVRGAAYWPREPGFSNARPGSEERQPRPDDPSGTRTPKEALTYIEGLYRSGRMEELATLLRQREVFREAWLMLQRSSPAGLQGRVAVQDAPSPEISRDPANLPVPQPRPSGRLTVPKAEPGSPRARAGEFLTGLAAYLSQDRHFAQDKEPRPRLSLRV